MFHRSSSFLRAFCAAALVLLASCNGDSGGADGGAPPPGSPGSAVAIRHFFIIVLENRGYDHTFGPGSTAPYLSQTLPAMGQLLTHYYGTGHASLDNYISMVSGQPPNALTQADCQLFQDFLPAVLDPREPNGIYIGQGCIYPASVHTIADELEALNFTWKGYMQDLDDGTTHTCRHPSPNSRDGTQSATATNQYATRHNPFMYFDGIIGNQTRCDAHVVDLAALDADLASIATTPNYNFITPDLCADGHDDTCADASAPGGYAGIDAFLQVVVPKILNSPAFKQDGLLLVTFDESDSDSPDSNDACCGEVSGPNTTAAGAGAATSDPTAILTAQGGGRVGGVIISPFTRAGTVNDTPYNHYSMLRSVANMFGLAHLGYAGTTGLAPFGADVYNNGLIPSGTGG